MEYLWNKEPRLSIRSTKKPIDGLALSGVVLICEKGVGHAYIKFDQGTIEKIGNRMPYGLGPENQAYLKVVKKHRHYDVMCTYLDKSKSIALWKTHTLPNWVKNVKRQKAS